MLPPEIFEGVLEQLRIVHSDPLSTNCATCYSRDLHSIALSSRSLYRVVRPHLYDQVWIVGSDSALHTKKKFKIKYGCRLKLLRRTLRENPSLAVLVRELKVPNLSGSFPFESEDHRKYSDVVASVVMCCPSLERLVGFYPTYCHEFDRLRHALSTRTKLQEQVWIIGDSEQGVRDNKHDLSSLRPEAMDAFLRYHDLWQSLHTLILHSQGKGILDHELFVAIFSRLPSLEKLCVSNFRSEDFNDSTLQALPALRCLRLQDLHGLTDDGVFRFASRPASRTLESVSFINLELMNLAVISKLFASLHNLKRFILLQDSSPELPVGGLVLQPVIASSSVEFLHWDVLIPGSANDNLAHSIRFGGFPNLRTLRAPSDHHGVLQAVCKPLERIAIASDKFSLARRQLVAQNRYSRTLSMARTGAQDRIEEARRYVQFKLVVEEDGIVKQIFHMNGFMGSIGSGINYSLAPDVKGSDNAVIDVNDLTGGENEYNVRDGCTGMWNAMHPAGKRWWYHTERYRFRRVDLEKFF
ncbi:hypothetical protein GP486_006143 [Trichoglossum hirsutum]|uniref:F-box domain-containing protein n=1 Tax=Trichoglossum hirsutum TaxID=265104 RepID=A0A9P8L7W6_9PEZI|nr:hypothetical protein GP486_006143 [Trichoglossum hirsutum]